MISFAVSAKLICAFVFAYEDCWFSDAAAQLIIDEWSLNIQAFEVQELSEQKNNKLYILQSNFVVSNNSANRQYSYING